MKINWQFFQDECRSEMIVFIDPGLAIPGWAGKNQMVCSCLLPTSR